VLSISEYDKKKTREILMKRAHGIQALDQKGYILASETNHVAVASVVAIDRDRTQSCLLKAIDPLTVLALQSQTLNALDKSKMPDLHRAQFIFIFFNLVN
jgi:hypothetical protein